MERACAVWEGGAKTESKWRVHDTDIERVS